MPDPLGTPVSFLEFLGGGVVDELRIAGVAPALPGPTIGGTYSRLLNGATDADWSAFTALDPTWPLGPYGETLARLPDSAADHFDVTHDIGPYALRHAAVRIDAQLVKAVAHPGFTQARYGWLYSGPDTTSTGAVLMTHGEVMVVADGADPRGLVVDDTNFLGVAPIRFYVHHDTDYYPRFFRPGVATWNSAVNGPLAPDAAEVGATGLAEGWDNVDQRVPPWRFMEWDAVLAESVAVDVPTIPSNVWLVSSIASIGPDLDTNRAVVDGFSLLALTSFSRYVTAASPPVVPPWPYRPGSVAVNGGHRGALKLG